MHDVACGAVFLVTHALVIAFIGPQDPVGSYLMLITAPLLAALACVRRARDSHQAACKWRTLGRPWACSRWPCWPCCTAMWPAWPLRR